MELKEALVYLLIGVITLALYFLRRNLNYWKVRGIPHEEPHIVMGNCKGIRSVYSFGQIVARQYHKFKGTGPFCGVFVVKRPAVVLLDKTLIKNILIRDFNNFPDRGMYYNEQTDPLTGHLFFLEGQKWKILRNKLSPTFSSGKMKYMYPTLLKITEQLIQILQETIKRDPIVDVRNTLARFTTDIISSCAFGIECNSLYNSNSEFPRMGKKAIEEPRHNSFIMALIDSFPHIARKLGMRILPDDVHEFFMSTIKDTIKYREQHNIKRNDFLNILLELKNNENDKSGLGGLSIEDICAQVFVFFLGGFETSSSTLTYALYELAQNHEVQERLRQEVNKVIENNADGIITHDNLKEMLYLDQVLKETLRKYPAGPVLIRQAINDYEVPGHAKYVIEKGTQVIIPLLGLHYDPEYYPQPDEFQPERFDPEVAKQRDSAEYLPFGDGPRYCIGDRFGKMQSLLGLAYLVKHFRFSTCSKTQIPMIYDPKAFTHVPKCEIYLQFEAVN